jgi:hypothetical protein
LNENLAGIKIQLAPADLNELDAELPKVKVPGGYLNEMQMQTVDHAA